MCDGHLEGQKNPDRLKRIIHVDRKLYRVHLSIYMLCCGFDDLGYLLFAFNMSVLLRNVEDVTTISKSQSLTSVRIQDCTLRVPNKTTTLFLYEK